VLGDTAWAITNKWNDYMIAKYEKYVAKASINYVQDGSKYTCEDFALSVLIDFSSENELPLVIYNGTGTYTASSDDYSDIATFKNDVLKTTGARDLQNDNNTSEVSVDKNPGGVVFTEAKAGDVILFRDRGVNANHTQLITGVFSDGSSMNIAQGNSDWWLRIPGSSRMGGSNPQSSIYVGTEIELGSWVNVTDSYYNSTTGKKEDNFSKKHNIQIRRFNFKSYNGK
jgi:hypothetical protein